MKKLISDILNLIFSCFKFIVAYSVKKIIIRDAEIYLIGSNYGTKRSDNAEALYNYILSLGKEVYFIEDISADKSSLKRGSFKSFVYYFRSKGVFYSHSFSDILPGMHKVGWLINKFEGPKKIFIQHGVISLKRIDEYIKSLDNTVDYFVTSTEFEKKIVKDLGIYEEKIKVTGLPRYDVLPLKLEKNKRILIFLTWKDKGDYLKKLKEIIEAVEEKGCELRIAAHNMVKGDVLIPKNYLVTDIGRAVRESAILITDDSSVAWDFFYNGREVIFYKSEEQWYLDEEFLNSRKVESVDELKDQLVKIKEKRVSPLIPNDLFEYRDKKNSKRVFDIVNN